MRTRIFTNISKENERTIDRYTDFRMNVKKLSSHTAKLDKQILRKLAHLLDEKPFQDATVEDLQNFFKQIENHGTYDTAGTKIKVFYRWLLGLNKKETPEVMKWFEYTPFQVKQRNKDPNFHKKHFITKDDYQRILNASYNDSERALWETYYLSGGRRKEIANMKIGDVDIHQGKVEITLYDSKTIPRNVPLPEPSPYLTQLLSTHPEKDNPKARLWLSFSGRNYGEPIHKSSINQRLTRVTKRAGINKPITPHDFRRTRATIYFSDVNEKGYHRWDDKEVSMIFGWTLQTTVQRRNEYDLTGYDNLKEKIFKSSGEVKTYKELQIENKELKTKHQSEMSELTYKVEMLSSLWYRMLSEEEKRRFDNDELLNSFLLGGAPQ